MSTPLLRSRAAAPLALFALVALFLAAGPARAADVTLSGAAEVPPVTTAAKATAHIVVTADGAVSGMVMTEGVQGTMAHIHAAPAGKNGPVIIPLTAGPGGEWLVPAGAHLDADQLKAYHAGGLYVNVHSTAHPGGEIRAQLAP